MGDGTYNGWTNYATWGVALVLSNDRSTYDETREYAAEYRRNAPTDDRVREGIWTAGQCERFMLADRLREDVELMCEDATEGADETPQLMTRQIISASLADVDWHEIAVNILSELDESAAA